MALEATFWIVIVENEIEELLRGRGCSSAPALLSEQKYWVYFKGMHKAGSLGEQKLCTRLIALSHLMGLIHKLFSTYSFMTTWAVILMLQTNPTVIHHPNAETTNKPLSLCDA